MIHLADTIIARWRHAAAAREGKTHLELSRATRRANRIYEELYRLSRRFPEVERHLDTIHDGPIYL